MNSWNLQITILVDGIPLKWDDFQVSMEMFEGFGRGF